MQTVTRSTSRNTKIFLASLLVGTALVNPAHAADLDLNGVNLALPQAGSFGGLGHLNGADNLSNGNATAATLTEGGGSGATYTGNITDGAGTTGVHHISGTVTFSGTNTFTGGLQISGGTITAAAGSALGATTNTITLSGGNLTISGATTVNQLIAVSSAGTLTNALAVTADDTISGTGALTKAGAGVLTLTGTNTHTGGIIISAGSISAASNANLGGASNDITFGGGNLTYTGNGTTLAKDFVVTSAGTVTMANNNELSGVISGAETLTKAGAGTLTLSGTQTGTGGITVTAGAVSVAADANLTSGTVTLNGGGLTVSGTSQTIDNAIAMTGAGTITDANGNTFSGNITGSGDLTKAGAGVTVLSGTNNAGTGGINVNAGTLSVASDTNLTTGTVALSTAALTLTGTSQTIDNAMTLTGANTITSANANTLSGGITSTGSVTKAGAGALTLSGTNNFSGGMTISAGSVSGADANLGTGDITFTGGNLTLTGAAADNVNENLVVTNSATITNTNNNTLSGTVSIANTQTLTTSVASGTTLTASGIISSAGALTKTGTGTLVLSGANTYSGATTVTGGTLRVNGTSANSAFTVGAAGTLGGSGTITGNVTNTAGGTVAAGNSIGTLTITGNYSGAGGAISNELDVSTTDLIAASGTANITGGTLTNVFDTSLTYASRDYTILTAAGGLTGTFTTLNTTNQPDGFLTSVYYTATAAHVVLTSAADSVLSTSNTATILNSGQSMNTTLLNNALWFSNGGFGMQTASAKPIVIAANTDKLDGMAPSAGSASRRVWMQGIGNFGNTDSEGARPGFDSTTGGILVGADREVGANGHIGIAAGYTTSDVDVDSSGSSADINTPRIALYGSNTRGNLTLAGTVGYALNDVDTDRPIASASSVASASHDEHEITAAAQASYKLTRGKYNILPSAGVQYVHLMQDGYTETGATGFNMTVDDNDVDSLRPFLGVSLTRDFTTSKGMRVTPTLSAKYSHEVIDDSNTSRVTLNSSNFTITGVTPDDSIVSLGGGVNAAMTNRLDAFVNYNADIGDSSLNQTVSGGLRLKF